MGFADLRYAIRLALRSPAFTLASIASLTIAIGANSTVFTLIDSLFFRPLPVRDPGGLVVVEVTAHDGSPSRFAYPHFEEFSKSQTALSDFSAYDEDGIYLIDANGDAIPSAVAKVSGNFYRTVGVHPQIGRPLTPEDDGESGHPPANVTVISDRLWRKHFGSDPKVLGKIVKIQSKPFVIVGVNPPAFFGLTIGISADAFVPIHGWLAQLPNSKQIAPENPVYDFIGRLKSGVELVQARAQLEAQWPAIRSAVNFAGVDDPWTPEQILVHSGATGLQLSFLRRTYSKPLLVLMGAVAILLLIACVNLANLTLARAGARSRDTAIRIALGASAWTLVRHCLIESLLLSLTGATLGVWLSVLASHAISALLWFGVVPLALDLSLDVRTLLFTSGLAILTGLFFSIVPGWNATRLDPTLALQHGKRIAGGPHNRLSRILILLQVALSMALLTAAALFAHSLLRLRSIKPGFDTEHVLTAMLMPRPGGHAGADLPAYYHDLLQRIRQIPGVADDSLSSWQPVDRIGQELNEPVQTAAQLVEANRHAVTPGFFSTLGMQIVSGRDIQDSDLPGTPPVAAISNSLAKRLFPGSQPVGQQFVFGRKPNQVTPRIVGVVSDANLQAIRHSKPYAVYLALYQEKRTWPTLEVRTYGRPEHIADSVRREIEARGRTVALAIDTVASEIDDSFVQDRLLGYLSSFFSIVAVLLASIGLHGLLSLAVTRRTVEIGIRMALGAKPDTVKQMVLWESMRLVLLGAALGLLIALPLTRLLGSFLYRPQPALHDSLAIAIAATVLLSVAVLASWIPARRAASTDPMSAIRSE